MHLEQEVLELRAKLSVLEKFVMGSLMELVLDAKLKALEAAKSAEGTLAYVQSLLNEAPGGEEDPQGDSPLAFDVRSGSLGPRPKSEEEKIDESN